MLRRCTLALAVLVGCAHPAAAPKSPAASPTEAAPAPTTPAPAAEAPPSDDPLERGEKLPLDEGKMGRKDEPTTAAPPPPAQPAASKKPAPKRSKKAPPSDMSADPCEGGQ